MSLTLIKELNKYDKSRKNKYGLYKCFCGNEFECLKNNVNKGNTKSCGCVSSELKSKGRQTHGLTESKVYRAWCSMKRRCYNENDIQYSDYGGKGIEVCKRWKSSFENFFKDMGHPPSDKHSVDRINVSKNYSKSNCKWSTYEEQANNKNNNRILIYKGKKKTMTQWAKEYKKDPKLIWKRLSRGWTVEESLETPKGCRRVKE